MKVAYNKSFGGFSLSPLAEQEYFKKKGIHLTYYKKDGDGLSRVEDVKGLVLTVNIATQDLGERVEAIPTEYRFSSASVLHEVATRCDPDLIEVIERLGKKANGLNATIAIQEVPDGTAIEISECDGSEEVWPARTGW